MRVTAAGLFFFSTVAAAEPVVAYGNICLAEGKAFALGSVLCLRLPAGERLARCEMVLNNTSWETVGETCSSIDLDGDGDAATPLPGGSLEPG